ILALVYSSSAVVFSRLRDKIMRRVRPKQSMQHWACRSAHWSLVLGNTFSQARVWFSRGAGRFPHKQIKRVGNSLNRLRSIQSLLNVLPLTFQRSRSKGIDATYHFTFTGGEERRATVTIRNEKLEVTDGHVGDANISVTADSQTWLGFLAKERNLVWALLTRRIRIKGSPKLLLAFGKCFPS